MEYNFFFDLDGTVTRKEILPEIGRAVGMYDQIAELTRQTIQGEIPFHESFLRRVKMFANVPISTVRAVIRDIPLHTEVVDFIQKNSHRCYLATGNLDVWISELCERIGIRSFTSIAKTQNDYITGVQHVFDKSTVASLVPGPYVAIGEGNNDAAMIGKANIGIAFGAVHSPAKTVMEEASHAIYDETSLCRFLKRLL